MAILNQQLETFIVTADLGSFRRAGDVLYISPTAVQKQITILETHLGVKLFLRTHRGLQLTPAGRSLYADGKYILGYAKDAEQRLMAVRETRHYEIRAVLSPISPLLCLPVLWKHVHRIDASYTITVAPAGDDPKTKAEILQSLGTTIDLVETAFDENRNRELGLRTLTFRKIPIGIVLPFTHPLAQNRKLTVNDLRESPLIIPKRGLNQYADAVRNELVERGSFTIIEIDDYTVDTYNLCVRENACLLALNPTPVHPLLVFRTVDWAYTVPYGLMYPDEPSPMLMDFLRLSGQILRQPGPYADIISCLP